MAKHTPGPWKVTFGNIIGADNKGIFHQSVMLKNVKTAGEMEANARLIAAAPELLEACYLFSGAIKMNGKTNLKQITMKQAFDKARKAIAKAEGK